MKVILMTSSLDKLNALSALAGLSRKAVAEREAAPKTPVNNAQKDRKSVV